MSAPAARLSRRTVLRGAGGAAVALPALEIMGLGERRAHAAPPARFVLSYGGISTGAYRPDDELVPATVGRGYDVRRALKPLGEMGLRDDVSVVTGLLIPWAGTDGDPVPPGGRSRFFHFNTAGPQIAGTSTPATRNGRPRGPTADQIVAGAIAAGTAHRVLAYRVQAAANHADAGRLSWRLGGGGALTPQEPIASPRLAYQSLFAGAPPPGASGTPADGKRVELLLKQRRSVLDFVAGDIGRLMPRVGPADRARLQRHFDEIRGLEQRLASMAPSAAGLSACKPLPAPGADPPIGPGNNYSYNGEDQRADVLTDLVAMAFACDLSRVSSFMITEWKCYMNVKPVLGYDSDMHELTHGAGPLQAVSDSVAWHVRQWGKLVTKLKGLPEGDGTVLDRTALVLVFEGGHGWDPEGGRGNAAHSTENMAALVAGRAGGLKPGQHVPAKGKHPAQVVLSAMNAAGVTADALGEVKGNIPELFR
jgi:hypothetical protein